MTPANPDTIFIVDDNSFSMALYEEHLLSNGFKNIMTFHSGGELVNNLHLQPGLILLDYNLGDMNGSDILKQVRAVHPEICVVIISGQKDLGLTVELMNNGAFDYIVKDENEIKRISVVVGKWLAVREYRKKFETDFGGGYSEKCLSIVAEAQEKVRQEISHELHDNVNQLLGASMLYLRNANADKTNSVELINESVKIIDTAIAEIRRISHSLQFVYIKEAKLETELERLIGHLKIQKRFRISTHLSMEDAGSLLSPEMQHHLLRIIQEQLNNIVKYSNARTIKISIVKAGDELLLTTEDDGIGFYPAKIRKGLGLTGIVKRIDKIGGNYNLSASQGKGCKWSIRIPLVQPGLNPYAEVV